MGYRFVRTIFIYNVEFSCLAGENRNTPEKSIDMSQVIENVIMSIKRGTVVVIVWLLDLQLPM
jgi:hypothetical protein